MYILCVLRNCCCYFVCAFFVWTIIPFGRWCATVAAVIRLWLSASSSLEAPTHTSFALCFEYFNFRRFLHVYQPTTTNNIRCVTSSGVCPVHFCNLPSSNQTPLSAIVHIIHTEQSTVPCPDGIPIIQVNHIYIRRNPSVCSDCTVCAVQFGQTKSAHKQLIRSRRGNQVAIDYLTTVWLWSKLSVVIEASKLSIQCKGKQFNSVNWTPNTHKNQPICT